MAKDNKLKTDEREEVGTMTTFESTEVITERKYNIFGKLVYECVTTHRYK